MTQRALAIALIAFAIVLAALGSRRAVSGASCTAQPDGRACDTDRAAASDIRSTSANQTVQQGLVNVFAPPAPQSGLTALQLSIQSGAPGLAQPAQKQVSATTTTAGLHWPVSGPVTQLFGVPELGVGAPHTGVDIGEPAGSPVRAAEAGRVTFAGGDPCCSLGYWVEINHGDHYSTRYGHMMRPPIVVQGDFVNQGQILGFSGNTGFSTGPHVHFELRYDGAPIDPLRIIPTR